MLLGFWAKNGMGANKCQITNSIRRVSWVCLKYKKWTEIEKHIIFCTRPLWAHVAQSLQTGNDLTWLYRRRNTLPSIVSPFSESIFQHTLEGSLSCSAHKKCNKTFWKKNGLPAPFCPSNSSARISPGFSFKTQNCCVTFFASFKGDSSQCTLHRVCDNKFCEDQKWTLRWNFKKTINFYYISIIKCSASQWVTFLITKSPYTFYFILTVWHFDSVTCREFYRL